MLLFLCLLIKVSAALLAYNCDHLSNINYYSSDVSNQCELQGSSKINSSSVSIAIYQVPKKVIISAEGCTVKYKVDSIYCTYYRDPTTLYNGQSSFDWQYMILSHKECWEDKKLGTITLFGKRLSGISDKDFKFIIGDGIDDEGFCSDYSITTSVTYGWIKTITTELELELDFSGAPSKLTWDNGLLDSNMIQGYATSMEGWVFVYDVNHVHQCHTAFVWQGIAQQNTLTDKSTNIVIDDLSSVFSLAGSVSICNQSIMATNDPSILISIGNTLPMLNTRMVQRGSLSSLLSSALRYQQWVSTSHTDATASQLLTSLCTLERLFKRTNILESGLDGNALGLILMGDLMAII